MRTRDMLRLARRLGRKAGESAANARLIALAPALADVLRGIVSADTPETYDAAMLAARAILANLEG